MALNVCWRLTKCVQHVLEHKTVVSFAFAARRLVSNPTVHLRCLQYTHTNQRTGASLRSFCSAGQPAIAVTYEELKKLLVGRSGVVIDVREPWELREYGHIPGAINVPLAQVNTALQLNPEDFKDKYGGDMPLTTENVVFTCLAGLRSIKALEAAVSLGYSNAQHYPGGWQDWAKHEILQTKEWPTQCSKK